MDQVKQLQRTKSLLNKSINDNIINLEQSDPELSEKLKNFQKEINNCKETSKLNSICVNLTQLLNSL